MAKKRKIIALIIILLAAFAVREVLYNISFPINYKEYILKYSDEYNIDPYLMMAIINTESRFNKDAASHKGAIGLMQLTEPTAEWIAESMGDSDFNTSQLYDPETNIKMGGWYINNLRDQFGTMELVLAAYNAGRGNVANWISNSVISEDGTDCANIPYKETEQYIRKVMNNREVYKLLYNLS
jgi:Soluble lytic murein transglycosylase and related regulatory proteins (some contain LysM/invasin domains)